MTDPRTLPNLAADESGVTLVELGLILALISLACIIAFTSLGLSLTGVFTTATQAMAA